MNDLIKQTLDKCIGCSLDTYGIWECCSEDAIDLSGSYEQKILGYFEGELSEVLEYCTKLDNFYQWGDGGYLLQANVDIDIKDIKIIGYGELQKNRRREIDRLLNVSKEFIKKELCNMNRYTLDICELSDLLIKYKSS